MTDFDMCDALDDLYADAQEQAPKAPVVHDVPAGFFAVLRVMQTRLVDRAFMAVVDPALYLALGQADAAVRAAASGPYMATSASARAMRHAAYSEGFATPPARQTVAERRMQDAHAFGLVRS